MSSRSAMTLRIVAGDRRLKWRLASTREPTGSAESTYSRIKAIRTSRCRSSIGNLVAFAPAQVKSLVDLARGLARSKRDRGSAAGLQELDEERVRDEETGLGERHAIMRCDEQTARAPRVHPAGKGWVRG